ncbi:MAG: nucleotidyltransferase domain-containing protein [Candidatus Brocadiales bacterium]
MAETTLKKISQVDGELLKEIVSRIVNAVHPARIILFGSHAYGRPKDESDLDILVIMHSELPRYRRSVPIYRALAGLLVPKDILAYTQEEIEEWSEVPQAFITTVLRKGKVIYEKE